MRVEMALRRSPPAVALAVTALGRVYVWGTLGQMRLHFWPKFIHELKGVKVVGVAAGWERSAVTSDSEDDPIAYWWGE